jgi:hypothetical protein
VRVAGFREVIAALDELDCGDSNCHFAKKRTGMRTQRGCRCLGDYQAALKVRALIEAAKVAADELEKETKP